MSENGQMGDPDAAAPRRAERDRRMTAPRPLVAWSTDYAPGDVVAAHHHPRAQLLYAVSGVMTVVTEEGAWVTPPERAVCLPEGHRHEVRMHGAVAMRTLYVATEGLSAQPFQRVKVIGVSGLLRELILAAMALPLLYDEAGPAGRLVDVLLDEIAAATPAPLHLPTPRDIRAQRVAEALIADPGYQRDVEAWGRMAGVSGRNLARLFRAETGLTFGEWRRRLRLMSALERLSAGRPVTEIAFDLGYDSPSAFIAMFKRALGAPPTQYLAGASTCG